MAGFDEPVSACYLQEVYRVVTPDYTSSVGSEMTSNFDLSARLTGCGKACVHRSPIPVAVSILGTAVKPAETGNLMVVVVVTLLSNRAAAPMIDG